MTINRDKFAIHCSTQYGNLAHFQKALQNHEIKERIKSTSIMVSAILSMQHQVFGDLENGPTTCTGALTVLGNAYRMVKHGYLDVCVAGGFDTVLDSPGHKIMDTYGLKKARDGSI